MSKNLTSRERKNVLLLMEKKTDIYENRVAVGIKQGGIWKELTFRQLGNLSRNFANYIIETNIKKRDKIAILSESKPEWGAALFSSVLAGTLTVPLDVKLTIFELRSILSDCQPKAIFVSKKYLNTAIQLRDELDFIEHIFLLDEDKENQDIPNLYNVKPQEDHNWRHRSPSATALIIYTSGTTGNPKGVEITFGNILSQLEGLESLFNFGKKDAILSILPMNHLFELTVGFFAFMNWGVSIYYSSSLNPKDLVEIMREKDISFMIVVPAFLKLLKATVEKELHKSNKLIQSLFSVKYQLSKYLPYFMRKILFKKIHNNFGGKFKACISGGAPLDINIGEFYETIGITIFQGYGMTETSPVIGVNYKNNNKMGSIGKPMNNVRVKIDKNSEVCVKGPNVMKGYYNRPDLTDEVFDTEGWLHTGDIGEIDKDGFLFITGRIKNLIVLSGGKKVHPEEVEATIELCDKLAEVCVLGLKRKSGEKKGTEEIAVVVVPKLQIIEEYSDKSELEKIIKKEIQQLSKRLSSYKRPNKIIIQYEELQKTSTRKIKRKEIAMSL